MKTLRVVVLLSLVVVLLAGCGGLPPLFPTRAPAAGAPAEAAAPSAPAEPSAAPAEEAVPAEQAAPAEEAAPAEQVAPAEEAAPAEQAVPAEEAAPTEEAAPAEQATEAGPVMGAGPLAGVVWEWAASLKTEPASQAVVPNPSSYTAVFDGEGNVLIQADCNIARAVYALENEALTIEIGPLTRAACTPGSLSNSFLDSLGQVASYMIENDSLVLRLGEAGDSLLFRNGGPAAEPVVPAEAPAGVSAAPAAPEFVGVTWNWEDFIDNTGAQNVKVADPANYTVTFAEDGTVAMKADCNQAAGTFSLDGSNLAVSVGPVTLAMCSAESLGEQFLVNLTSVATVSVEDGKLLLDLMADGGTMIFAPAQ